MVGRSGKGGLVRYILLAATVAVACVPVFIGAYPRSEGGPPATALPQATSDAGLPASSTDAARLGEAAVAKAASVPKDAEGENSATSHITVSDTTEASSGGNGSGKSAKPPKDPKDKKPKKGEDPPPPPPPVPEPPAGLVATSGDMSDSLSWSAPATGTVPAAYEVAVGGSADGPFETLLQTDATSCSIEVTQTAVRYYAVRSVSGSLESSYCAPAANGHVSMSADIPPSGYTLRASNGEVELVLPPGAYAP
ncbi:MAG: hypothetical protein OEV43_08370, partial [Coriobacteriia bacterium]|nr:hypothetical protein [Coriobacteriia bacterium]